MERDLQCALRISQILPESNPYRQTGFYLLP